MKQLLSFSRWLQFFGLLGICTGLGTFSVASQTVEVTSNQQISEHWRGSFDILVRPDESISEIESQTGVVEGNYLGTPSGGITREQYELIRDLKDVEVAAPVATIGYLLNDVGTIGFQLDEVSYDTYYQIEGKAIGTDELLVFPKVNIGFIRSPGNTPVVFGSGCCNDSVFMGTGEHHAFLGVIGDLPPQWTLVAGIDPEEEANLIGLDKAVEGEYLPTNHSLNEIYIGSSLTEKAASIPIIVSSRSFLDGKLQVKIQSIKFNQQILGDFDVEKADSLNWESLISPLNRLFNTPSAKVLLEEELDLDASLRPLSGLSLTLRPNQPIEVSQNGLSYSTNTDIILYPGSFSYQISPDGPGEISGIALDLLQKGEWGEIKEQLIALKPEHFENAPTDISQTSPIYRSLTAYKPPDFRFEVIGEYDFQTLELGQDEISYVPLGIYEPPHGILRFDQNNNSTEPSLINPGINPGNYIPRPPMALTTLEGAEYLRGREDFIDAVRVRVAGIDTYSSETLQKVEKVAEVIVERTGLHVDIVATSSPQKVLVKVPKLGFIEERWTTIGAAASISKGINYFNIILFTSLLVGSTLFLVSVSQVNILARKTEIGLLNAFGWQSKFILRRLLRDHLFLGFLASLFAGTISLALNLGFKLEPNWGIIGGISLAAPLLYVSSVFPVVYQATRQNSTELIRHGEVQNIDRKILFPRYFNFPGIALRQLFRRRARSILTLSVLATSVLLTLVLSLVIIEMEGKLQVTLLGELVVLSVRPYHYLMISIGTVMGLLVIFETLMLGVLERSGEFGLLLAFGWHKLDLMKAIIYEGIIYGFVGGFLGIVPGLALFALFALRIPDNAWLISALFLIGFSFLGALTAVYPALLANHLTPFQVLTGTTITFEPAKHKFNRRVRNIFIISVTSLLVIFVVNFISGNPLMRQALVVGTGLQKRIESSLGIDSGSRALEHARAISELRGGLSSPDADDQIAAYISRTFKHYGLEVEHEVLPLTKLFISQSGETRSLFSFPGEYGEPRSIAYHSSFLQSGKPIKGKLIFIPKGSPYPSVEEVRGHILLIEEDFQQIRGEELRKLVNYYGAPAPYLAAASLYLTNADDFRNAALNEDLEAAITVSQNIVGTLPGSGGDDRKEIWLVSRYDTTQGSPGADESGSGIGVLLELSRLLAEEEWPVTIRFLALTGTESGLEGQTAYLLANQEDLINVRAVIDFEQLGAWRTLIVAKDLDAPGKDGSFLPERIRAQRYKEGQRFIFYNWKQRVDVDDLDIGSWLGEAPPLTAGLAESPEELLSLASEVAEALRVLLKSRPDGCTPGYIPFLYEGLPAIVLCGEGNGLIGSPYDTYSSLDPKKLEDAVRIGYQLLLRIIEEQP